MDEMLALYGADGRPCGAAPRSRVRRENLRHAAAAVVLRNRVGAFYVHRRTDVKDIYPGLYDFTAGGCVLAGEEPAVAAQRELAEELGVIGVELLPVMCFAYADDVTDYIGFVFEVEHDGPITHQVSEVAWGAWLPLDELLDHLDGPTDPWPFVPDSVACAGNWLRSQAG
jgi:8-oxo-dGTP pyrophosphatase MutT (NUDIX family)